MKKSITLAIIGTAAFLAFAGCASGPKLAAALAKDPATASFSIQLVTPWGQQNVSLVRSGGTNSATAQGGAATINK